MHEFLTAVWLEAAYMKFVLERRTELERPEWFYICQQTILCQRSRRAYN